MINIIICKKERERSRTWQCAEKAGIFNPFHFVYDLAGGFLLVELSSLLNCQVNWNYQLFLIIMLNYLLNYHVAKLNYLQVELSSQVELSTRIVGKILLELYTGHRSLG